MSTMPAAVLDDVGDLRIEDVKVPEPGEGDVLIHVAVCGVCRSDATEYGRHLTLAAPPVVLGDGFSGTVEALGPGVTSLSVGSPRGVWCSCLLRRMHTM
jgi:(R,R)-butanediol dehydrogenase/meso-butanediol dehydrogenase/diacetyl reductase